MRQTDVITSDKPMGFISATFDVSAIEFSNPTISPIYFRQGGTDLPTANSADFVVPAQSLLRLPAVGKEFGYGFADIGLLVIGNITTARITVLDANESMSAIGSVQPIARPPYYERERHPLAVQAEFSANPTSPGTNGSLYIVPSQRKGKISGGQIEITNTSFTVSDFVSAFLVIIPNGGTGINLLIVTFQCTALGQTQSRVMGFEHIANPGDELFASFFCNANQYEVYMNAPVIEFDE